MIGRLYVFGLFLMFKCLVNGRRLVLNYRMCVDVFIFVELGILVTVLFGFCILFLNLYFSFSFCLDFIFWIRVVKELEVGGR